MATHTTGEVCAVLGFTVTPDFIKSLNIEPAEEAKGRPRWSGEQVETICAALCDHLYKVADKVKSNGMPAGAAPKPRASKDTATPAATKQPVSALDLDDDPL